MPVTNPSSARLQLAAHVRACQVDGQVILLDLRRGRYIGVGAAHQSVLAEAISGWPAATPSRQANGGPLDVEDLVQPLLAQGLLLKTSEMPRTAPPSSHADMPNATRSLNAEDAVPRVQVGARRLYRFLRCTASASLSLRCRPLMAIADAVVARGARNEKQATDVSRDALVDAVAAYLKLRPLIFTAHDRCLYDALTLVGFLASEGIGAQWVIGVRTRPFAAHAWVQSGDLVLSDPHEHVRRYRPILVA